MTLLVGIRCTDGVVIAADSAVTFGAGQMTTISDSQCKIEIIQDQLIVAGTGQVGLGQRFRWVVDRVWQDPNWPKDDRVETPRMICANALQNFASTKVQQGHYGALLAYPAGDSAELCEFALADMQPELKTETMWYASMGSGQTLADPYLRLMRTVFWQDGPPNLQGGRFAACWVLKHAIDAAPGGLGDPITMAVLERQESGGLRARMIEPAELDEHEESVKAATAHFRDFESQLENPSVESPEIPEPPKS